MTPSYGIEKKGVGPKISAGIIFIIMYACLRTGSVLVPVPKRAPPVRRRIRLAALVPGLGLDQNRRNAPQDMTPRDVIRLEFEDLELDELRLELHKIDILLSHMEDARKADVAEIGSPAAGAGDGASDSAGGKPADAAADGGGDGVADSSNGPAAEEAGRAASRSTRTAPLKGGVLGAERKKPEPALRGRGDGGGREATETDAATADGSPTTKVTGDGDGDEAADTAEPTAATSMNGAEIDDAEGGGGSGSGRGSLYQEGGGDGDVGSDVLSEADTVAAFWAAVAAAAPPAAPPGDVEGASGGDGKGEEQEEDGEWGGPGDSPLAKDSTYESLSVPMRVAILSAVCEEYMDEEHFRERIIVSFCMRSCVVCIACICK